MESIKDKLAQIDQFKVDWAGRDEAGNLVLNTNMFRVTAAPPPFFGYNLREYGFATAEKMANDAEWDLEHDFGICAVVEKSLIKIGDDWYVELKPPKYARRKPEVATVLLDDDGEVSYVAKLDDNDEPVLDDDGNPVMVPEIEFVEKTESKIMVKLEDLEPVPVEEHPLAHEYRQRDRDTASIVAMNERSEQIANGKSGGGGRGKGKSKRKRLSPSQLKDLFNG